MDSQGLAKARKMALEHGKAVLYTASAAVSTNAPRGCIQLWTIQLGQWRKAKAAGIEVLNITAQSGVREFAPDFDYVMAYKRGELDDAQYTQAYLRRMRRSQELFPKLWESLTGRPLVALACYCRKDWFCHRHLFAELAREYLVTHGHPVQLKGELW